MHHGRLSVCYQCFCSSVWITLILWILVWNLKSQCFSSVPAADLGRKRPSVSRAPLILGLSGSDGTSVCWMFKGASHVFPAFFLWLFSWRRSFGLFLAMNVLRRLESGSFSVCTFCFYSHFRCQKTDSSSPKLLHQHHSICTFTTVKRAHGPAAPDPALWFKETVQPKKHHSVVICSPSYHWNPYDWLWGDI